MIGFVVEKNKVGLTLINRRGERRVEDQLATFKVG